jgi:rod shape-determining protein MreD
MRLTFKYSFALGLFALFGLIIATIFPKAFFLADTKPDFLLLLVVFNGMFMGFAKGGAAGFLIGLLEDLFFGRFIGLNAVSKAVVGAVTGAVTKSIFKENLLVPVLNVGWATILKVSLVYLVGRLVGNSWGFSLIFRQGIFETIYNICLVPFIYGPFFNFASRQLNNNEKSN